MTCILLCSLMTSPSFSGMEGDRQTDLFLGAVTLGVKASTCEFWRNTMPQHGHVQEVVEVVVVVSKLCLTLATSYCSMPGFSALHYLLKFAQGRKLKEVVEPDSMPGLLPPEPEFLLITHFSLTGHISTHYFYFLKKKKKKAILGPLFFQMNFTNHFDTFCSGENRHLHTAESPHPGMCYVLSVREVTCLSSCWSRTYFSSGGFLRRFYF